MNKQNTPTTQASQQWWRSGYAWLAFSGPAIVVVASFLTAYIAVKGQDPIIEKDYYEKGLNINKTLLEAKTVEEKNALAPAMQARNHAATGVNTQP